VTAAAAARRRRRPNLARLNHVLIPRRSDERDRYRRGLGALLVAPVWWAHGALSREGRATVGLSALVAAAGLDVGNSQVYLLWAALTGLLAGSLALRPVYSMRRARLRVQAPRRATAHEDVTFVVEITSDAPLRAVRVDTPFLPWDGRWTRRPPGVATVEPGEVATVRATARFVERGEHHLDPFRARALVPLGLAAGAPAVSATCRFLVLPRLARVEAITLREGSSGERRRVPTAAPAEGGDLAGVRPYRPGDSIRHLHARTWARVGEPHVREHVRETSERAALLWLGDASSDEAVVEAGVSLAAGIAAALMRTGAGLGVLGLGADIVALPGGGSPRAVLDDVLDRLATWAVPRALDAAAVVEPLGASMGRVSTAVIVAADRDRAPGEVPEHAVAVAEALRAAGVGVTVALVVEEDAPSDPGAEVVRVGRKAIERLDPIRL
jgi:uncharacterized protein (DUF58 family)